MTEQVLKVLGKLDERNIRSIIWVTLEQAKLIILRQTSVDNTYFTKIINIKH